MREYFDAIKWWRLSLLLPYFFLLYKVFKSKINVINYSKSFKIAYSILLIFSFSFIIENLINNRFIRKALNNEHRVWINIYTELKRYNSLKKRINVNLPVTNKNENIKNEIIVLVIGESLNKNHISLYGYKRNTNPLMSSRNDLIIFNDVISKHTSTLNSILNFYTSNFTINDSTLNISLLDLFNSANYETYWISNQSPLGIWDNAIFNLASTSKYQYFLNQCGNNSKEALFSRSYDELILPVFQKIVGKSAKQFFTIHLLGNHTKYAYRYPDQYNKFNQDANSVQETINEYDNSVLYNDYIVHSIINILSESKELQKNTKVAVLYLSDHGENVYDFEGGLGHNYENVIPNCLVEIPYIIWTNELINQDQNKSSPGINSNLIHHLLGLSNIQSTIYDSTKDLNSIYYIPMKQRILENNQLYEN